MSLRKLFPWTYALWHLLSSKPVRIVLVTFGSLLIAITLAFHFESFLFQRRVNSVLSRLVQIHLERSSEQDVRGLLPESRVSQVPGSQAEIRHSILEDDIHDGLMVKHMWRLGRYSNPVLGVLYGLGHRFHRFTASVDLQNDKVVRIQYDLWVSDNQNHSALEGTIIEVNEFARAGFGRDASQRHISYDDFAPYAESVPSNAPPNGLRLSIVSETPEKFRQAAYDVQLRCLWSSSICNGTKEVLPGVWPPQYPWRSEWNLYLPDRN